VAVLAGIWMWFDMCQYNQIKVAVAVSKWGGSGTTGGSGRVAVGPIERGDQNSSSGVS
jgi:hypothetical protein